MLIDKIFQSFVYCKNPQSPLKGSDKQVNFY